MLRGRLLAAAVHIWVGKLEEVGRWKMEENLVRKKSKGKKRDTRYKVPWLMHAQQPVRRRYSADCESEVATPFLWPLLSLFMFCYFVLVSPTAASWMHGCRMHAQRRRRIPILCCQVYERGRGQRRLPSLFCESLALETLRGLGGPGVEAREQKRREQWAGSLGSGDPERAMPWGERQTG
jgi:hypothetical protein